MKSWMIFSLSAAIAIAGSNVISSTTAQEVEVEMQEQESPILSEDDFDEISESPNDPEKDFQEPRYCALHICEGDRVRIRRSPLYGFTGISLAVDQTRRRVTVLTETQAKVSLPVSDLKWIKPQLHCLLNFCIGDQAKIVVGSNRGFRGYVTGFDRRSSRLSLQRTYSGPTLTIHIALTRHARW